MTIGKAILTLALAVVIGALWGLPAGAQDDSTGAKVSYLLYYNSGGYTVKSVKLHWKKDGVEGSRKFNNDLTIGMGFCAALKDLKKRDESGNDVTLIPEGAEVWLSFNISGGDNESCRKDKKLYFSSNKNANGAYFWSKGTTLNNNRCRTGKPPTSIVVGSGSGNCEFDTIY